jgi:PTS system nitrogen regulatory IIA component
MRLGSLTNPQLIFPDLPGSDGPTVLRAFADLIGEQGLVNDSEDLYRKLWEREQLGSTGIGAGVAIPHCKVSGIKTVLLAVGITTNGIDFGAVDHHPVKVFFLVISPSESPADHLQSLAAISKWVKADRHVERILKLEDRNEIFELLEKESE